MDAEMWKVLGPLLHDLGIAIDESVDGSKRIDAAVEALRKAGYDAKIALEAWHVLRQRKSFETPLPESMVVVIETVMLPRSE